jgi:hypothetical protein
MSSGQPVGSGQPNEIKQLADAISSLASQISSFTAHQKSRPLSTVARIGVALSVAGFIASIVAIYLTWENRNWSRETRNRDEEVKRLDIADHFIDRFYQIELIRDQLKRDTNADAVQWAAYYNRVYGLHSEEFTFYRGKLLDKPIYLSWLRYRHRMVNRDKANEQKQWGDVRKYHIVDPAFLDLMDQVVTADNENKIEAILDTVVPPQRGP